MSKVLQYFVNMKHNLVAPYVAQSAGAVKYTDCIFAEE